MGNAAVIFYLDIFVRNFLPGKRERRVKSSPKSLPKTVEWMETTRRPLCLPRTGGSNRVLRTTLTKRWPLFLRGLRKAEETTRRIPGDAETIASRVVSAERKKERFLTLVRALLFRKRVLKIA